MDNPRGRAGTVLGDYRLDLLLEDRAQTLTWLAEQVSVHRPVLLVELKQETLELREEFLADVRARAAISLPAIGSVYEAVSTDELCFVAMERLSGTTLADRAAARDPLQPVAMAFLLGRLAEVMISLETDGVQTLPLELRSIHLDPQGIVRMENIACAGPRRAEQSAEDVIALGALLPPLLADAKPGTSRLQTLLSWMRGEGLEAPLNWQTVRDYSMQIERQLNEQPVAPIPTQSTKHHSSGVSVLWGGLILAALGIALYCIMRGTREEQAETLAGPVPISAGTYPDPDGGEQALPSFEIAAHEVTIREYRDFLDALKRLPESMQNIYDVEGQPASKQGHQPAEWNAMLAAAKNHGMWQGRAMSLECPVVNVDWWDAMAYCQQRGGRLPTQAEWYAALRARMENPRTLSPAVWGQVQDIPRSDLTPNGLYGMAGSVSEWTREVELNPANPLGAKSHLIIGASFMRTGGGALAREWTEDLGLRRPDLGFRIVTSGQ